MPSHQEYLLTDRHTAVALGDDASAGLVLCASIG